MSSADIARLGAEIRRRRKVRGETLGVFALRAGLSPNFIGQVELGRVEPALSVLLKLAKGLGVAPADLFGLAGLSPAGVEFAHLYQRAPREVRDAVLAVLRAAKRGKAT